MRKLVALMAVSLLALAGASTAVAQDLICNNTSATAFTGSADNVEVPPGADCFLLGTNVDNVKVFGSLRAAGTVVRGNVQGEPGHGVVRLGLQAGVGTTVNGSVQIKGGVGPSPPNTLLFGAMIQGNVQLEENSNGVVVLNSLIGGDLQVFKNTGVINPLFFPFSASIGGNTIGGNLQCAENSPPPAVSPSAGPNTVGGSKAGVKKTSATPHLGSSLGLSQEGIADLCRHRI